MTDPDLKPCPRCGGTDIWTFPDSGTPMGQVNRYRPQCQQCGLTSSALFASHGAAAAWWNERPAEQAKAPCQGCDDPGFGCRECEQPEPTRNAKDAPLPDGYCGNVDLPPVTPEPKQHECPYGGIEQARLPNDHWEVVRMCGTDGWLCDRCQLDADKRMVRALVRALLSHNKGPEAAERLLEEEGLL